MAHKKEKTKRLYQIDLLRFIAAISVVLYHYLFRGNAADHLSVLSFGNFGEYFKYGYLGVDLFFIISGFVIVLSVQHNSIRKFVTARIVRLYPAYWLGMLLTFIVIILFGAPEFTVNGVQLLANLTMFQNAFDIENIDDAYWSLLVELRFYFMIGVFLVANKFKKIKIDYVVYPWLVLTILYMFLDDLFIMKILKSIFILDWSSYFIAGILFYQIYVNKKSLLKKVLLLLCFLISFYYAVLRIEYLDTHYQTTYSASIIFGILFTGYMFMYLISTNRLNYLNSSKLLKLGMITYPLYLIHQNIGYVIFNNLEGYMNKFLLFGFTFFLMLVVAYFISSTIEPKLGLMLRKIIEKYMFGTKSGNKKAPTKLARAFNSINGKLTSS